MDKLNYDCVVGAYSVYFYADLIAIKIESESTYLITKSRNSNHKGQIVSEKVFTEEIFPLYYKPLIFSDVYVDIDSVSL